MNDDLDSLAVDLAKAGLRVGLVAGKVVEHHARQVRDTARELAPRTRLPHYAQTITHEVNFGPGYIEGVIGPETGGQGSLGAILERGTSVSPPHAHLGPALDRDGPDFMRDIADAADPLG